MRARELFPPGVVKKYRIILVERPQDIEQDSYGHSHCDNIYRLEKLIEFDDTYIGGRRAGKRDSGAEGKKPVLVDVETRTEGAAFEIIQRMFAPCSCKNS